MKMKYSNHNRSVYVDKIFRTGIVAKDGQLRQGDNIVAIMDLDVVKSINENKRMVLSKVQKKLNIKNSNQNGEISIRIKRVYIFNSRVQLSLERKANVAYPERLRTRTIFTSSSTSTSSGGTGSHHQEKSFSKEEKRKIEIKKKGRTKRLPRYGEHYRVKIAKGSQGLGLRFTTSTEVDHLDGCSGGGTTKCTTALVVTDVIAGSMASTSGISRGDILLSFSDYPMKYQKYPMRAMRQLAHNAKVGDIVDMVFLCMGKDNGSGGAGGGSNKRKPSTTKRGNMRGSHYHHNRNTFGKQSSSSSKRQQTLRPHTLTCEVMSPSTLVNEFGRRGSRNELVCSQAKFGPPIPDTPGIVGHVMMASPTNGCTPFKNDDSRYKNSIVIVERGDCYFNSKVVHAQRVGAIAVIVMNYPNERTLFSPDIDEKATMYQPEPVIL